MLKLFQLFLILWTALYLVGCAASPQPTTVIPQTTASTFQTNVTPTPVSNPSTPVEVTTETIATPTSQPTSPTPANTARPDPTLLESSVHLLAVTNSQERYVLLVDPASGVIVQIEAGAAPWGLAQVGNRMFVSTARVLR